MLPKYVLITPARNEAKFIELTIKSVISQAVTPLKWVIVSDGSTDGTDEIVSRYAAQYDWIELVRQPERKERHFAGKVLAFNAGYERVKDLSYDAIGCMDGDISFDETYFAFLLEKMEADASLGLVGTPFRDPANHTYDFRFSSTQHVTGCCQLFRRQCFEQIGGYVAVKGGAIDRIAAIGARMNGWKTRTFQGKEYLHHRKMGTAQQGMLMVKFRDGIKDYSVGTHPLWAFFRAAYQMSKEPLIAGGFMLGAGYFWALFRGLERPVSREMVAFCRREQMERLKHFLFGRTLRSSH